MQKLYKSRANGKLLLTAEYLVLDGAKALALPCKFGQTIEVSTALASGKKVHCTSIDMHDQVWFEGTFDLVSGVILSSTDQAIAERFLDILKYIHQQAPSKFAENTSTHFKNKIDFERLWGLGTSSTLIYNLATWAEIDAYELLAHTFGGSGYDIACAGATGPLQYKIDIPAPRYKSVTFAPPFLDQLYFVYLGKKQNSREGIQNYREQKNEDKRVHAIAEIEELNDNILHAKTIADFEESIEEHESIIANIIGLPKVKDLYFSDLEGAAKSLGAWGGDFVLLTYKEGLDSLKAYCQLKGFEVVIPYQEMIL